MPVLGDPYPLVAFLAAFLSLAFAMFFSLPPMLSVPDPFPVPSGLELELEVSVLVPVGDTSALAQKVHLNPTSPIIFKLGGLETMSTGAVASTDPPAVTNNWQHCSRRMQSIWERWLGSALVARGTGDAGGGIRGCTCTGPGPGTCACGREGKGNGACACACI